METLDANLVDAVVTDDLQTGKAGEYLVCADLILAGYVAFPSDQGLPFDVVAGVGGRLIKVQVKTTRKPRALKCAKHTPVYLFHVKRMGKKGAKTYSPDDVDVFAFVALDTREIGYVAAGDVIKTMCFRSTILEDSYHDASFSQRAAKIKELRSQGLTYSRIAEEVGVDRAFAHRVIKGTSGAERSRRFLKDYTFADAINRIA